ncbi:MAG: hypothetical protein WCJ40_21605 [Planctomycetota bacterium]|nr:hypothetical protein [Planctomycetota bacterium]
MIPFLEIDRITGEFDDCMEIATQRKSCPVVSSLKRSSTAGYWLRCLRHRRDQKVPFMAAKSKMTYVSYL